MNRRDFLQVSTAGSLALGMIDWLWLYNASLEARFLARPELLHVLGNPRLVHQIGEAYRRARPDEDCAASLEAVLRAVAAEAGARESIQTVLGRHVREDFACGRTVQLDGWILSVTEARQCALYSILY